MIKSYVLYITVEVIHYIYCIVELLWVEVLLRKVIREDVMRNVYNIVVLVVLWAEGSWWEVQLLLYILCVEYTVEYTVEVLWEKVLWVEV